MIGSLFFYGAILAWDFYVNVWQSALILVGIFLFAVVLNLVAVWVVFGAMRDIERYLAKQNSLEAPGVFQGFSHTALNRFGALLTAMVDVVYAGIVFTHYHGLAPQSVAIFFAACAWGLLSKHMTSRVDGTGPQAWLGFCGAMLVYAIGFAYLNPTPTRPATVPVQVAAPAETGHGEDVTPAEAMPPSGASADADQLRLCSVIAGLTASFIQARTAGIPQEELCQRAAKPNNPPALTQAILAIIDQVYKDPDSVNTEQSDKTVFDICMANPE